MNASVLHDIANIDTPERLRQLLDSGANPNEKAGLFDIPAISYFCLRARHFPDKLPHVLQLLVQAGCDPNGVDIDGNSPLYYLALSYSNDGNGLREEQGLDDSVWDLFDLLIGLGATPSMKNLNGEGVAHNAFGPIRAYLEAWSISGKSPRERVRVVRIGP